MRLSRDVRRGMKNNGIRKKLEGSFYKTISDIKDSIKPIDDFKFTNKEKTYDITSLLILSLSLLGARNADKGFDLVHTYMYDLIKGKDYTDDNVKIYLIGANLSHILSRFEEAGLHLDISNTLNIATMLGLYNGDLGGHNLDAYYSDDDLDVFKIVDEDLRFKNMYLSTVYSVSLDIYSLCMFAFENIVDEFLMVYMLMLTLSEESEIYMFLRICMGYCIKNNLKDGKDFAFLRDLSGDIFKDLEKLDSKFTDILKALECDVKEQCYVIKPRELSSDELNALESYRLARISATLDYMYKLFLVKVSQNLKDLKNNAILKEKQLLKENRSLSKKLSKMESNLKAKSLQVDKLTKEIRVYKKNNVNTENLNTIEELKIKLKGVESKNVALINRINTLETKLKNITTTPKVSNVVTVECEDSNIEVVDKEPILSMEDKLEGIKNTRLLVVGGNSNWFLRLKDCFPYALHIDINQKGSNYSVPSATECVLVVSNMVKHSHVFRLSTQLRKGVPIVSTPNYRLSDIVDLLYKKLLGGCEN